MRYLKFESFRNKDHMDGYFNKIEKKDFLPYIENTIKLSQKEVDKLKSLFVDNEIWVLSSDGGFGSGPYTLIQRNSHQYFYSDFEFYIYKCDDDWYYVDLEKKVEESRLEYVQLVSNHTYYKCDQWDGLLALIKEKLGRDHSYI